MEMTMSNGERIHIDLTEEQQSAIKRVSGKNIVALEFDTAELEQRIAPTSVSVGEITITKHTDSSSTLLFNQ
jgi:type VI protein secretion system component Hcp